MPRSYRLTDDMSEKEKAVGGILTFGQAGWLALGLILFGAIFMMLATILPKAIALIIGLLVGLAVGLPFAFYEKDGLRLASYLSWRIKFAKKNKYLPNTLTYRIDRAADAKQEQGELIK